MTSHTATSYHLYRTIADVVTNLKSAPNWISMPEPAIGAMPLVMVDLRSHDDARAWAGHIGLTDPGSVLVNPRTGQTDVSFVGEWLGWRVLLTGRQSVAVEAVSA
jgi:hypothetical protein